MDTLETGRARQHAGSQRKLRNLLIDARFQGPWVFGVSVLTLAIFFTLGAIIVRQDQTASSAVLEGLAAIYDPEQAALLSGLFLEADRSVLWALVGVGSGLVLALAASLLVLTHRVAGPMVAVRYNLARVRDGRFNAVRPFRRGDAFREVSDDLLAMTSALRAREEAELNALLQAKGTPDDAQRILDGLIAEKQARIDG